MTKTILVVILTTCHLDPTKNILVLGAGRSSQDLINYLLNNSKEFNWTVTVGDKIESAAHDAVARSPYGKALYFDLNDSEQAKAALHSADLVISLLPPGLHVRIAKLCLDVRKNLFTASYVSPEMKELDKEASEKDLLFLNECGLDPGIDHMSAMQRISRIRREGGQIVSFASFTGGLIAPETDPENPWRYKFTWNPRNVVTAGQSGAEYLQDGKLMQLPYKKLFKEITYITVPGVGSFEGYANRDSIKYLGTYGLDNISTMIRGTLRNSGFCSAWNVLVQLGCCDDISKIKFPERMTNRDFINLFVKSDDPALIQKKLQKEFQANEHDLSLLSWSGFFDQDLINITEATPAEVTEKILMKKWKLNINDRDMIVMWHRFVYDVDGTSREIQSSLVVRGKDEKNTAMAKTVGLPLGIVAKLFLQGKISQRGVCIPVTGEFYEPVLTELKKFGIEFKESLSNIGE